MNTGVFVFHSSDYNHVSIRIVEPDLQKDPLPNVQCENCMKSNNE